MTISIYGKLVNIVDDGIDESATLCYKCCFYQVDCEINGHLMCENEYGSIARHFEEVKVK